MLGVLEWQSRVVEADWREMKEDLTDGGFPASHRTEGLAPAVKVEVAVPGSPS